MKPKITGVGLDRKYRSNFDVLASVVVEGRKYFAGDKNEYTQGLFLEYSPYLVIKPLAELDPIFLKYDSSCWHKPCDIAPFGYFIFPDFRCGGATVFGCWHASIDRHRFDKAEMTISEHGIRFYDLESRAFTVGELIEKLQAYDKNLPVVRQAKSSYHGERFGDVNYLEVIKLTLYQGNYMCGGEGVHAIYNDEINENGTDCLLLE